jgi:hypothetical protein
MKPTAGQGTIRQMMIELLHRAPMDVVGLAHTLALPEKEVLAHLPHIAKSVAGRKGRFIMHPARCLNCGYQFKDRRRLTPPGRCPRCKQSRLQGPDYQIIFQ